jgi:hypothetical protein
MKHYFQVLLYIYLQTDYKMAAINVPEILHPHFALLGYEAEYLERWFHPEHDNMSL